MIRILLLIITALFILDSCTKDEPIKPDIRIEHPSFSLAIIPDTHVYNREPNNEMLISMVNYINSPLNGLNIAHCLHVGDLTDHNYAKEWENALLFYNRMSSGIEMTFCLGNHDYESGLANKESLMKEYITSVNENIVISTLDGSLENSFSVVTCEYVTLGILSLEFAPRNMVISWAQEIISSHPDKLFVILTHAYLDGDGEVYNHNSSKEQPDAPYKYFTDNADINDGEEIWEKLVYPNENVRFVVCGHSLPSTGYQCNLRENKYGGKVCQLLVNFQHYPGGGQGYFGILAIDPLTKHIKVRAYSPYLDNWKSDVVNDFKLDWNL